MQTPQQPTVRATVRYQEHSGAPAFLWLIVTLVSGSLGLAYSAAVGPGWGIGIFVLGQALGSWWLLASRARIAVDDTTLYAGRATLPARFVRRVEVLDAEQARYVAGPGADARAYLVLRGSGRGAVKVDLDDPADPTPYWLLSCHHPERVRDALIAAKATDVASES